jgi:hypothetical protein
MDGLSLESFLLLVVLVLLAVVLFLSLVTALTLTRVLQLLARKGSPGTQVAKAPTESVPPEVPEFIRPPDIDIPGSAPDLPSALELVRRKYGIDSLVLSSWDGLPVASSGSSGPAEAAARYSQTYRAGEEPNEQGVHLLGIDFRGSILVAIIHRTGRLPEVWTTLLRRDLTAVLRMIV